MVKEKVKIKCGFLTVAVIIIIICVLAVGGIYLLSQRKSVLTQPIKTPSQPLDTGRNNTTDWKIYSNQSLGITIKYPNKMAIDAMSFNSGLLNSAKIDKIFLLAGPKQGDIQEFGDGLLFAISIDINESQLTLQEYVEQTKKEVSKFLQGAYGDIKEYQNIVPKTENVRISDYNAFLLSNYTIYGTKSIFIQNPATNEVVILSYDARGKEETTYKQIADQMIHSFQFSN